MAMNQQWETWVDNAVLPFQVHQVDPSKTWVPSPKSQQFPLPNLPEDPSGQRRRPVILPGVKAWQAWPHYTKPKAPIREELVKRGSSRFSFRFWRDWLALKKCRKEAEDWPSLHGSRRQITAQEWRAFGYWARPTINGVLVDNSAPPTAHNLNQSQVEAVMRSLKGTDGSEHPENWIPGLEHPSLPPKPPMWPIPPGPSPHPSEIQLNPFLQHHIIGKPPVLLDIRTQSAIAFAGETPPLPNDPTPGFVILRTDGPNGAQPATYPGVSTLHITALADDPMGKFPWPFIVLPTYPEMYVTVGDVLNAIIANFEQLMTVEEIEDLGDMRRRQIVDTIYIRQRTLHHPVSNGIQRVDYLGDRYMFRGLEPAPDGNGWMMFVGPPS